jgi:hypothetical protein
MIARATSAAELSLLSSAIGVAGLAGRTFIGAPSRRLPRLLVQSRSMSIFLLFIWTLEGLKTPAPSLVRART